MCCAGEKGKKMIENEDRQELHFYTKRLQCEGDLFYKGSTKEQESAKDV